MLQQQGRRLVGVKEDEGRVWRLQTWGPGCPRFVVLYLISPFLPFGFKSRSFQALPGALVLIWAGRLTLSTAVWGMETQLLAELQVSQKRLARVFLLQGPVLWLISPGAYI